MNTEIPTLCFVVKHIIPSNMQKFMQAWMKQSCKDFRLVFIDKDLDNAQQIALDYAFKFAENCGHKEIVMNVQSEEIIPQSRQMVVLNSTSILPIDDNEVLAFIVREGLSELNVNGLQDTKNQHKQLASQNHKVFFKIVIPNYNNMQYIKQCLDSILGQTFEDFIAIVVDDLSTDLSDKFAQLYAKQHPDKIMFAQLPHKGFAGAARNYGIEFPIQSEYTWFVDSDDYLASSNVLKNMHDKIVARKFPDLLRCTYIRKTATKQFLCRMTSNIDSILQDGAAPFKSCIRSSFKQHFVEGRARNNDVVWFMQLMDTIDTAKISSLSFPCYVYNCCSSTSCQNSASMKIKKSCIDADRMLVDDLKALKFNNPKIELRRIRVLEKYALKYKPAISINDLMKHSMVISIDQKRLALMYKLFKSYGFSTMPQLLFGSMFKDKSGPYNCKHSHMRAVQFAKEHNWPYVMLFEDDAYPCDNAISRFEDYLYAIPADAQLVVFGWSNDYKQRFDMPFNRITTPTISGSHSYILFKESYDNFIKYHQQYPDKSADNNVFMKMSPSYVIDWPIFIQYTESKSMNGHIGFAFYGNTKKPPRGFSIKTQM